MAGAGDLRDIMDLGRPAGPRPAKKKKPEIKPRVTGVNRELMALMGDSVPPIQVTETPKYKSKPQLLQQRKFKPRHWESRSFTHGGRTDGLVFRHWKRAIPGTGVQVATPTAIEVNDENKDPARPDFSYEEEFPSDKWNVKIQIPSYSDEQYEQHLKSDDWTKNETDYLLELSRDFDLRWILIADRYLPDEITAQTPAVFVSGEEDVIMTDTPQKVKYPDRSMEDLKKRYYTVAATVLALQNPPNTMNQNEFSLWEKMKNFDAKTEGQRKLLAEKLFERSKEEAEEEQVLIQELARITKNEDEFLKMRKELYDRLDPAPSKRSNGEEQSTAMYQTSSGLSILLQTLLAKEKRFKRPNPMPNGPEGSHIGSVDDRRYDKGRHPNQYSRRDTLDTQADSGTQKKGSQSQPNVRPLTPEEELRYGVSHPQERLTSGIQFRHDRITKISTGKSIVQTQKLQQALVELGIPTRLVMPTDKVCKEFERLVGQIQLLLDARKGSEKVWSEVEVLREQRRIRLGEPKEGEDTESAGKMEMETGPAHKNESKVDEEANEEAEDGDEDAEGEDDTELQRQDTRVEDDDEADNDVSALQNDDQDEDEDAEEEEEEEDEEEEEEDEDDDDEQSPAEQQTDAEEDGEGPSFAVQQDDDDDDNEVGQDEDEEEDAEIPESGDELAEEESQQDEEEAEAEAEDEDEASDGGNSDAPSEPARPPSSQSAVMRLHKRSASVVSDSSRAGSNRSGMGRKKRK